MTPATLLIVDDHPLFREGFAYMARALRPHWSLDFAGTAEEGLAATRSLSPDVAIIDVRLPEEDGFSLVCAISACSPLTAQILISGRDDPGVRIRAETCGARGFIPKTARPEEIVAAIETVLTGGRAFSFHPAPPPPGLTSRQAEVLDLLAQGHGNKEIRHQLGIAERTVRAHLTDLFQLLGAHSRTQAIIRARELGLIA